MRRRSREASTEQHQAVKDPFSRLSTRLNRRLRPDLGFATRSVILATTGLIEPDGDSDETRAVTPPLAPDVRPALDAAVIS